MNKVKLGDICKILNGYSFKSQDYVNNGIRIMRITNVQKGYIEDLKPVYYPMKTCNELNKYMLKKDDILISLTGNVGRVALIEEKLLPAFLNQRVGCLRIIDNEKVYPKFLYNLLNSEEFENNCIYSSKGIAQLNLSTEWLKGYEINLPSLEEQKKISNKLNIVTSVIENRKKQLEKINELVKSQFVEMFGELTINDKNWLMDNMGNYLTILTDFSSNGSYKTLDSQVIMYDKPNYAYMVRTTDLENDNYTDNVKYIDENAYNLLSKSKVYGNEIIMCKIGSAGKCYLMPKLNRKVSLGRNAFLFRYNDKINTIFMNYLLNTDYGKSEISKYVRGAVTKTITKDDARKIRIIVPPIELQNKFASFVELIDKQEFEIKRSLTEMEDLYNSLMNEYFG